MLAIPDFRGSKEGERKQAFLTQHTNTLEVSPYNLCLHSRVLVLVISLRIFLMKLTDLEEMLSL